MGDKVSSKNQSGGVTAHTINSKNKWAWVYFFAAIVTILLGVKSLFFANEDIDMKDELKSESQNQSGGITAKDVIDNSKVEIRDNQGPVQYNENSPGSIQVINQKRLINKEASIEKFVLGNEYVLKIVLTQTLGIWDESTRFEVSIKTSGPIKKAEIVSGLPFNQMNTLEKTHMMNNGEYSYSTTTAPLPKTPIVLEIISDKEINLEKLIINPIAQ